MEGLRGLRRLRRHSQVIRGLLYNCLHRLFSEREGRYKGHMGRMRMMRWMGMAFFCQSLRNDLFCTDSSMFGSIMHKFDGLTSLFLCSFRCAPGQFLGEATSLRHYLTHVLHCRKRKASNMYSVLFGKCAFE